MTPDEFGQHVGRLVVYTPPGCGTECTRREQGVITSVNDTFVFVRYGADVHAKATAPENLALVAGRSSELEINLAIGEAIHGDDFWKN